MADPTTPTFDTAFEQVKELNEQFLTTARKAGNLYLDAYEKTVDRTIDLERKVAGMTKQEWLRSILEAQADLTREVTSSYAQVARSFLK
jgi:hypothetical protein